MEKAAKRISENIGALLHLDDDKIEVIAYGLAALFQMFIIFTITSVIGIIGHFWIECMILFFGVGFIRKSVGGAHSESFIGCLVISIFTISFMAFLSRFLFVSRGDRLVIWILVIVIFIFAFVTTYKLAPVASKNKPIIKKEKIKRLRRNAFITLILFCFASLILLFFSFNQSRLLSISVSLAFSVLWQSFVLTEAGHTLISVIDRKFTVIE